MKEMFDITKFAHVGDDKYYQEFSKEDLEKMKTPKAPEVKKEALPSSEEVEENALDEMLPQVVPENSEEPDVDNVISDADNDLAFEDALLEETLNDVLEGADVYLEAFAFIEKIKDKFRKDKPIDHAKVTKVAKAYTTMKLATSRMKVDQTKSSGAKDTPEYRKLKKDAIKAEKEYRRLRKTLTKDELKILDAHNIDFDASIDNKVAMQINDIKDMKRATMKQEATEEIAILKEATDILGENVVNMFLTESFEDIYIEGANLDIHKTYRQDLKMFRNLMRNARKALKENEFDDARKAINDGIKIMKECRDAAVKEIDMIDDDDVLTAICGFIFRGITIFCRDILLVLIPVVRVFVGIREFIDGIQDIITIVQKSIKRGEFRVSDINTYVNFVRNKYDAMIRSLEKFLTKIDDREKKYNEEKVEKESAFIACDEEEISLLKESTDILDVNVVNMILTETFEEIYSEGANWDIHKIYRQDLKTFKGLMRSAKKSLKAKDYNIAKKDINDGIDIMKKCRDAAVKEINLIDDDNVLTAICGLIFRGITIFCRDILLVFIPFVNYVVRIREFIDNIQDIINVVTSAIKRGEFRVSDINTYVHFVKNKYEAMIRTLEKFLEKIEIREEKDKKIEEDNVKESVDVITEKDLDPSMKPILDKLHSKGYQTIASSSGHTDMIAKDDHNKNGIRDMHHYSDARLVFKGKYDLGKAPKYWYWKKVDNADEVEYLDIEQISYDGHPEGPAKAREEWKDKYMKSLTSWVDSLPNVSDKSKTVEEGCSKEACAEEACKKESVEDLNEQIDTLFESVMNDLVFDILDI